MASLNRFFPTLMGQRLRCAAVVATVLVVGACSYTPTPTVEENPEDRETIFGQGGIGNLFGPDTPTEQSGIGVNSFLWRASLETISFMPVSTADAFGGLIITDWFSPAESPRERFKLNVYILGRTLRADGVRVSVFRQVRDATGTWVDSAVPAETGNKIEDSILTKARILRHETLLTRQ